jgi:microsomal epoxide hydrolase
VGRWVAFCAFLTGALWSPLALAETPKDRFFQASDGVKLHYLEAGKGPHTIVFVPGWLMPAAVFEAQVRDLSGRFRVVAFDPRSQGKSEVYRGPHTPECRSRDLHELLQVVGAERPLLAGWSLGVMEILDYLAKYKPSGIGGLALIDNSVGEGRPPGSSSASKTGQTAAGDRSAFLREFTLGLTQKPLPKPLFDTIYASTLRVPQETARELLQKPFPREYWRDTLLAQQVPILYAIRPRFEEQGRLLLAKRPGQVSVEIFADAGHALFLDEPKRFEEALITLAKRVWPPASSAAKVR